jgi:hypothetical protein
LTLIAPIKPLQLCADGGYRLRLGVLRVPLIMVPDTIQPCHLLSMVHILENSQNTLVPYSAYNSLVHTKSDDSFVTILTNSELHCATPHTPSYKYTQLPSPSPRTQHPQPRQTPHPLSYSALPATRIVSLRLQSTLLVSTSAPPPVISQHHMTHILLKTLPNHISLF